MQMTRQRAPPLISSVAMIAAIPSSGSGNQLIARPTIHSVSCRRLPNKSSGVLCQSDATAQRLVASSVTSILAIVAGPRQVPLVRSVGCLVARTIARDSVDQTARSPVAATRALTTESLAATTASASARAVFATASAALPTPRLVSLSPLRRVAARPHRHRRHPHAPLRVHQHHHQRLCLLSVLARKLVATTVSASRAPINGVNAASWTALMRAKLVLTTTTGV